ncbi:hypothetical protein GF345_06130 [Candidatus Woesearchaeota archaeon]|nr:hypothetical protein [Candidatus Woesearchaeota archaeon]
MVHVKDFGFDEEIDEEVLGNHIPTGWPKPINRVRLAYEVYNQSIEELYFWTVDNLNEEEEFTEFLKIQDVFAASEHSAFSGVAMQRLGLYQDKVSQFLATMGKMIKELFQLVREIRIIDERLELYYKANENDEAAEVSLKGYWIDLVEGGAKNPASVYGMSRELGFATLPDLFFAAPPIPSAKVDGYVASLRFNRKVKEVLSRKLKTYLIWREHTFKEHQTRRTFTIKYLRQHYDIIRMYMVWVKPYLRTIKRIQMDQKKTEGHRLVSAFEGSLVEIETLAMKPYLGGKVYAILNCHFDYRSRPEMKYVQEGYQRGPIHVGRTVMTFRAYCWTEDQLKKYQQFRAKEDFELMGMIDSSVQAAYTALGEELEGYLAEAGEVFEKKETGPKSQPKLPSVFDPFAAVFRGFGELGGALAGGVSLGGKKPSKQEMMEIQDAKVKGTDFAKTKLYHFMKRIKAAHGFVY